MLFKYNKKYIYIFKNNFLYLYVTKLELNPYILLIFFLFDCNCDHPNDDERRQCQSSGRGVQTRHILSLFSPREGLR